MKQILAQCPIPTWFVVQISGSKMPVCDGPAEVRGKHLFDVTPANPQRTTHVAESPIHMAS